MRSGPSVPILIAVLDFAAPAAAQETTRVSVDSSGQQATSWSTGGELTPDGRYVIFTSNATNLVAGDTNGFVDIFVRDRLSGVTEIVNVSSAGVQANASSSYHCISADGRFAAFSSFATNLVAGDTNGLMDVFVRDRLNGTTERVSVSTSGAQGDFGYSDHPSISADGRFVAFDSFASTLVAGDTNGFIDDFVRDRLNGTTERVSVGAAGLQGNYHSQFPSISADGRFVAFETEANNLVMGDTNARVDVLVRDRLNGTTLRVSVASGGAQATGGDSLRPALSADGRCVAFESDATNLVAGDTNAFRDIFVHELASGATERVSLDWLGNQSSPECNFASISGDGRLVTFHSPAALVPGDFNGFHDVFLRDRLLATTDRVSVSSGGAEGNLLSTSGSLSADGRFVVFPSVATNLVSGDTNSQGDVFVRDLGVTGFTSVCEPGANGVIPCPCGNPPAGPGRGCNNSAATGGASIRPSGVADLANDTLVFTTAGERPTAASLLLQGSATNGTGIAFGQGVRCAAGALKRMYLKNASGGSITAPDFGAGDLNVSARSLVLGDAIQPGQSRWYLVYYRDPFVLGGCPASAGFNCTQTGQVTWWP